MQLFLTPYIVLKLLPGWAQDVQPLLCGPLPEGGPMPQHFQLYQVVDIPDHLFRTSLVAKTKDISNGLIETVQRSSCSASFFRSWIWVRRVLDCSSGNQAPAFPQQ